MSDAPERIWVATWREGDWSEGDWDDNEGKTLNEKPCIEYVRADRIKALTDENAKLHDHIEGVAKNTHKIMVGYEAKLELAKKGLRKIIRTSDMHSAWDIAIATVEKLE
jgi:hypothetical protein